MKLTLNLNTNSETEILQMVRDAHDVLIVELGANLYRSQGLPLIRSLKRNFPEKKIVIDLRMTMEGLRSFQYDSGAMIDAGADQVRVFAESA